MISPLFEDSHNVVAVSGGRPCRLPQIASSGDTPSPPDLLESECCGEYSTQNFDSAALNTQNTSITRLSSHSEQRHLPSVTISEKSAIVENSFTNVVSNAKRFALSVSSSTMTITLSKKQSTVGRSL